MSRHLDVVHLSGDEYDRLMDEREILRQECERAWKEVDAIQRERDDHLRWRKELADKLHDRETQISNAWAALRAASHRETARKIPRRPEHPAIDRRRPSIPR